MASGVETAYLKDAVGAVVAKGLASVAMNQPQDPVEYLAFYLLHHIQKAELAKQHAQSARILEQQREEWAAARSRREQDASEVIQRQWKAHLKILEEARQNDEELKNIFADIEEGGGGSRGGSPGEDDEEGGNRQEENGDQDAVEAERTAAFETFKRSRLFVRALNKRTLGAMKLTTPSDNYSAMLVLKSVLYLQGAKPKQVAKPSQIRLRWKPYNMMLFLHNYDPCANSSENGLPKKRAINRVRRLLTLVHEDAVKGVSVALHAVYSWLHAVVGYRYARDAVVKTRREQGAPLDGAAGDLDEEDDDAEDVPAAERDEDEEGVREAEVQAQKEAEEEAALAAGGEGEEANEEE